MGAGEGAGGNGVMPPESRARHQDGRELLTGIFSEGSRGQEQEGDLHTGSY